MEMLVGRLRIRAKAFLLAGVPLAFLATLGWTAHRQVAAVHQRANQISELNTTTGRIVADLRHELAEDLRADATLALAEALPRAPAEEAPGEEVPVEEAPAGSEANHGRVDELLDELSRTTTVLSADDVEGMQDLAARIEEVDERMASLLVAGELQRANALSTDSSLPLHAELEARLDEAALLVDQARIDALREADEAEALARREIVGLTAGSFVIGLVLSAFIVRGFSRSTRRVVEALEGVAEGDLTRRVVVAGRDEIALLADALNTSVERTASALRSIERNAATLATASEELSATANSAGSAAGETAQTATETAAMASSVSTRLAAVAEASDELKASIGEIAGSAQDAAGVAENAVQVAHSTTDTVSKLGESSAEIGDVIKVITSIAEQTNLLALNATIESARAGEYGKGFAVVANEVKDLARQTSDATDHIASMVTAIQADSQAAGSAIAEISAVIGEINEIQATIAAAVEEQSFTTEQIAQAVQEAASGTDDIADNITRMVHSTDQAASGAAGAAAAAFRLDAVASEQYQLVGRFQVGHGDVARPPTPGGTGGPEPAPPLPVG